MSAFRAGASRRSQNNRGEPVYVNVYDLSPINESLLTIGLGTFHSGLEVHGQEWTFASGSGIFSHDPKGASGAAFRECILIGYTNASSREVESIVSSMKPDWPGSRYSLIKCNCNSFSDALARELLGYGIPYWINRMSWLGSFFTCCLPDSMLGQAPVGDSGAGGASSGDAASGASGSGGGSAVRVNRNANAPTASAFAGSGHRLDGGSSNSNSARPASGNASAGGWFGGMLGQRSSAAAASSAPVQPLRPTASGLASPGGGTSTRQPRAFGGAPRIARLNATSFDDDDDDDDGNAASLSVSSNARGGGAGGGGRGGGGGGGSATATIFPEDADASKRAGKARASASSDRVPLRSGGGAVDDGRLHYDLSDDEDNHDVSKRAGPGHKLNAGAGATAASSSASSSVSASQRAAALAAAAKKRLLEEAASKQASAPSSS